MDIIMEIMAMEMTSMKTIVSMAAPMATSTVRPTTTMTQTAQNIVMSYIYQYFQKCFFIFHLCIASTTTRVYRPVTTSTARPETTTTERPVTTTTSRPVPTYRTRPVTLDTEPTVVPWLYTVNSYNTVNLTTTTTTTTTTSTTPVPLETVDIFDQVITLHVNLIIFNTW